MIIRYRIYPSDLMQGWWSKIKGVMGMEKGEDVVKAVELADTVKISRNDVQLRFWELFLGNTVIFAMFCVTLLGIGVLFVVKDAPVIEKIVIAISSGIFGGAGGMTLAKLTK